MGSQFNINTLNFAVEHGIIDMADVLESTNEMRKQEILKEHGDLIKQYGHGKEKYWYFRIPDSARESGCFRRRSKNKEHIEKELCNYYLKQEKQKQGKEQKENMTLEALFYEFMEHKKIKVKAGTVKRMMADWERFYKPHPEITQKNFQEITRIDIDDFFNNVISEHTLKDKAFNNMCGILKQTLNYAVDAEYIDKSPYRVEINKKKIIPTRKKDNQKEIFLPEEQEKIISEMERRLLNNPSNTAPLAIILDFYIGVRKGEMLGLREADIFLDGNKQKIHICRQVTEKLDESDINNVKSVGFEVVEYTKSDCGDRWIPLNDKAMAIIKRIIQINKENNEQYKDYLFVRNGKVMSPDAIDTQLLRGCNYIGIPVRTMHKIRKSYASTLYRNGVPISTISKLLGHADESPTYRHYIFSLDDDDTSDYLVLNALNQNTISSKESPESVTNGDTKIIKFPANKKAESLRNLRAFH